jgi:hypothetical protein
MNSNKLNFFNASLQSLEYLYLSSNNLKFFGPHQSENLLFLDLSNNKNLLQLNITNNLKVLNLSNTSFELILNFKFSNESNLIEELDLGFKNLTELNIDYIYKSKNLVKINLRGNFFQNFNFLNYFSSSLKEIDLSNNPNFSDESFILIDFENIETLKISNTSFKSISLTSFSFLKMINLDLSYNKLTTIVDLPQLSLVYLNLSFNNLEYFYSDEYEFKILSSFLKLKTIDLSQSLSKVISNKLFYFNTLLEIAHFSKNNMDSFPRFCQFCYGCNMKCNLKEIKFDSNNLTKIFYSNLLEMFNLEYLNLENNSISSIEHDSFSDLYKLETLILSLNNLIYFNDTFIFSRLISLKFLNLSSNQLEIIQSNLFDSLFKLETLDLSLNRISFIQSFALNFLLALQNLHVNQYNDGNLLIESNSSFSHLDSIQNIFLSKSILKAENVKVILYIFEQKTKSQQNRKVLGITFYKSLFISSKYSKYDCNLTLYFIRKNIHFNLKTETEIFDYLNECSLLSIKNSTFFYSYLKKDRTNYTFDDFGLYLFWIYLFLVSSFGVYILVTDINHANSSLHEKLTLTNDANEVEITDEILKY